MPEFCLKAMFHTDLVIDLGTENTLIQAIGQNLTIVEPTVVALTQSDHGIWTPFCAGRAALSMEQKIHPQLKVIRPLANGVIVDGEMAHLMLKSMLNDKLQRGFLGLRQVLISAPFATSSIESAAFIDLAKSLGPRRVFLVAEPLAAAVGSGLPVLSKRGQLIVDIGKGIIEAVMTSQGRIVVASSLRLGGCSENERLINLFRESYALRIGPQTAEMTKRLVLSENCDQFISVCGKSQTDSMPRRITVNRDEILEVLNLSIAQVLQCIIQVFEKSPVGLVTDIGDNGVFLTGGGALRFDLRQKLQKYLGIKVSTVRNPLSAVASGNREILANRELRDVLC